MLVKRNGLPLYKIIGKANLDIPRRRGGNCVIYSRSSVFGQIMTVFLTVPTILNGENGKEEEEGVDKKSKERREKDRKALRLRRINSLKRQISIKEKMLEVGNIQLLIIYFCPLLTRNYNKPLTFLIIASTPA